METLTIYHNPRCSKSRGALALLQEKKVPLRIVEYLKDPPTRQELAALRKKLGLPPKEWIRKGEDAFEDAHLTLDMPEDKLLDAMAAHPVLIERPIIVRGDRAVLARPPERALELIGK